MKILKTFALGLLQAAALQEEGPTFRSEARVVTVDVMVRDRATRKPVNELRREDFRMRVEGKERAITYFRQDGAERRPLAMLVVFNLAPEGGLRELSRPAALASFEQALAKLAPEDEVAVYSSQDWFVGAGREMCALTKDRAATAKAMRDSVRAAVETSESERRAERGSASERSMSAAVERALEAARLLPQSQVALVYVSDGMNTLDTMEAKSRDPLVERLQAANVSFSAITLPMLGSYAAAAAVINPLGKVFGLSVTGSGNQFAKQTGGVTVEAGSAEELGAAVGQVVSAYASRYSLGFPLEENELRDRKFHRIEVKLQGAAGKNREVLARRSVLGGR